MRAQNAKNKMAKQKIVVPLSENDLSDLQNGEEFHWTFTTNKGEDIDVHVKPEMEEDIIG
jgi:hypothetical protein